MSYTELNRLCQDALSNGAFPLSLGLQLQKFSKRLYEAGVAHEALEQGAVPVMLRIIQYTKKGSSEDTVKSSAYKVLTGLLSRSEGLETVAPAREELIGLLYDSLYDKLEIANVAQELLCIFVEYFDDSFEMVDRVAREVSQRHKEPVMARLIAPFKTSNLDAQLSSALTLCFLMEKSSVLGVMESFVAMLNDQNIVPIITALLKNLQVQDVQVGNTTIRQSVPTRELVMHLTNLTTWCTDVGALETFQSRAEWMNHAANRMVTPNVTGRAKAIESLTKVAGRAPDESVIIEQLMNHLKQMEGKLEAVIEEQRQSAATALLAQRELEARLLEQQEANELKIATIAKAQVMELSEQKSEELFSEMEKLKRNQGVLLAEYSKNTRAVAEQQYLREHKPMWMFYQSMQFKLNEVLLSFKVLSSCKHLGSHPFVNLAGESVKMSDPAAAGRVVSKTTFDPKTAQATSAMTLSVGSFEQLSEQCSRALAFRYEFQIRQLEEKGARMLGECGVRRLLEAMKAGCLETLSNNDQVVVDKLVSMLVHVEGGAAATEIATIVPRPRRLRWQEACVFQKPGIKTLQGDFYSAPFSDVTQYGYRLGTVEEAKSRNYVQDHIGKATAIDMTIVCFHTYGGRLSSPSHSPESKHDHSPMRLSVEGRLSDSRAVFDLKNELLAVRTELENVKADFSVRLKRLEEALLAQANLR